VNNLNSKIAIFYAKTINDGYKGVNWIILSISDHIFFEYLWMKKEMLENELKKSFVRWYNLSIVKTWQKQVE
jgi:hypothetical protein